MALKLRLSRGGRKDRPFYSVVVADSRAPRDGRFIEKLGTYSPLLPKDHPSRVVLKDERIQYWLKQGAQPTDRVAVFLGKAGLAPVPEQRNSPIKSKPKAKAQERLKEREEKAAAALEAAAEAEAQAKQAAEEAAAAAAAPAPAPAEEAAAETPAEEAQATTEEKPADA